MVHRITISSALIMTGGSGLATLVITSWYFFARLYLLLICIAISLNIAIIIGNVMAMKEYKARGEKLASIASLILVITEASWPLVPIIFLVPVAFGLFLVHAIKGEATVDRKYARLAFIIAGIAITTSFSALVAFLYIPNAMSVFADIGYIWFAIIWAVFFIGRDMLPGLLMLALNNFKVIDHPSASGNDPTKGVSPTIQP